MIVHTNDHQAAKHDNRTDITDSIDSVYIQKKIYTESINIHRKRTRQDTSSSQITKHNLKLMSNKESFAFEMRCCCMYTAVACVCVYACPHSKIV
jgi:hypothetical protein